MIDTSREKKERNEHKNKEKRKKKIVHPNEELNRN